MSMVLVFYMSGDFATKGNMFELPIQTYIKLFHSQNP